MKIKWYAYACIDIPNSMHNKLIANTIIPWTVEWLYYYELWQATGEWLGGGEHPENEIDKTD